MSKRGATIHDITPAFGENDRVLFVGTTGSGKTTLAKILLNSRHYVVVLDVKGTLNWAGYRLVRRMSDLSRINPDAYSRIIYRPHYSELDRIDPFFRWIYERGNTTLYVDELFGPISDNVPIHFMANLTRGREKGIETWCATQRPSGIPLVAISEAEHVYCFRLQLPHDRSRMEDVAGIPIETVKDLQKREFVYSIQGGEISLPYTLKFPASDAGSPTLHTQPSAPLMAAGRN